jgi:hypothetical protein
VSEIVDRMRNLAVFLPEQRSAFNEVAGEIERLERLERHHALNLGLEIRARAAETEIERLRRALQKIVETTDDGCVEELAERALALSQAKSQTND